MIYIRYFGIVFKNRNFEKLCLFIGIFIFFLKNSRKRSFILNRIFKIVKCIKIFFCKYLFICFKKIVFKYEIFDKFLNSRGESLLIFIFLFFILILSSFILLIFVIFFFIVLCVRVR